MGLRLPNQVSYSALKGEGAPDQHNEVAHLGVGGIWCRAASSPDCPSMANCVGVGMVIRKRGRRLMRTTAGSGHAVKPASHPQGFGLDGVAGGQQKSYQAVGSSRGILRHYLVWPSEWHFFRRTR